MRNVVQRRSDSAYRRQVTELNEIGDAIDSDEEAEEQYVPSFDVSCEPMGSKALNFFAMKLVLRGDDVAVLRPIMGMTPFANICTLLGFAIGLAIAVTSMWSIDGLIKYLVPLMFLISLGSVYRMWRRCQPMTFDRGKEIFWPGRNRIDSAGRDHGISIDRINCIQTLSQYSFDSEGSHSSYELNLVLNDPPGERIHVMCVSGLTRFIHCYFDLSEFLNKPVWDADNEE